MTFERWQLVKEVLAEAFDRSPAEREAYLEATCPDEQLRTEVRSLLTAHEEDGADGSFLEDTGVAALFGSKEPAGGQRIGPYRLVGEIGRGGMGTVYRAVRDDDQYEREVALKLIRPGWDTDALVRRFLSERQILASLEHPHIARLYDGGLSEDGRPYFAMEYADGEPIDAYCDAHRLSIRQRLELFLKVARAVAYAHSRLVVHRDLKPSNILVCEEAGVGARHAGPQLLDFGVAKLMAEEPGATPAPATRIGLRVMTPEYAAPEQVRGEPASTATDVYALGVLLYELLTGRRPYRFERRTPSVVEQVICEERPVRPSTAFTRAAEADEAPEERPEAIGRVRGAKPAALRRTLRGDLDRIILKALRKHPERRYASAGAFADDIECYLKGRPVAAREPTLRYRTGKFVRRNRWGVGVAALVAVLLAGYVATVTMQSRRITRERDRAAAEAAKAAQVSAFLMSLFEANNPEHALGDTITARELLARGVKRAEALDSQPAVQAEMLGVLGRVYRSLGRYNPAESLLTRALDRRRLLYGHIHPAVAASLGDLGLLFFEMGAYEAAEPLYREALSIQRARGDVRSLEAARMNELLASLLRRTGDYEAAETLFVDVLETRRQLLGEEDLLTVQSLNNLAMVHHNQGHLKAAERLFHKVLAAQRMLLGNAHPDVATTLNSLGALLMNGRRFDEAESLFRKSLAMRIQLYGREHPGVALSLNNLGLLLRERGRYQEAESLLREALAMRHKLLGADHPDTALSLYVLAGLLVAEGAFEEAEAHYREALTVFRATLPEGHSLIARTLFGMGSMYLAKGAPTQAEPLLREGLKLHQAALGTSHWEVAEVRGRLGRCLIALGHYTAAEPLLLNSYATLAQVFGQAHPRTRQMCSSLVQLYVAWGKPEEAAAYREMLAASSTSAPR